MKIQIHKEVEIEPTIRTELLSSMFEVPAKQKLSVSLSGELPVDSRPWNIGLIVGPSGSGKTLILNDLFGAPEKFNWDSGSVIDDFSKELPMEEISRVCQSVGFNTIPSWLRPYSVLSNGERFRVEVSRYLLQSKGTVTIDEFTSVVDRQVAQFACHSIQKYIREKQKQLVAASCHYDIIPWLQPDWILEPGNPCRFIWRSLQRRPSIRVSVSRVKYETWQLFKDFHYMSAELNRAARCYGLYVSSSTELPNGMEEQFYDDESHSRKNGCDSDLGAGYGLRIPSAGYHGSGGVHEADSKILVRTRRSEGSSGLYEDTDSRQQNPDDASTAFCHQTHATGPTSVSPTDVSQYNVIRSGPLSDPVGPIRPAYRIASMCGVLYRPHPRVTDIMGFTRMVTLPDFQGLGLAFVLASTVASAYKALGKRLHSYPNHPAWIRSYQRSKDWMQVKEAGSFSPKSGRTSTVGGFGGRRCAVFQYIGVPMSREEAERLIHVETE